MMVALMMPLTSSSTPLAPHVPVRGWTILSDRESEARAVVTAAGNYGINHLQLSHEIVRDLRQIKEDRRRNFVNRLIDTAHAAGIAEVVLWDHAFYNLEYYPAKFRSGPGGTIDLDNPAFWAWFKDDYREMLNRVPRADGLVLTFIETGARAERQFSRTLKTDQEKLAAVVNAVGDVVIGERHLNLYARTFAYTDAEYANIIGAVNLFARPEIRLMMKETPHDFFLTHPDDRYAGTIARATLMEFDAAGEFNGQGIIANTWPEYMLRRWRAFAARPHIIGYTARTDRYGDTRLIGRPGEINLLALQRGAENHHITAEQVYDEFIAGRYGSRAIGPVKAAFKNAYGVVSSTLYTLGTNTANHSALDYDPYASSYVRHVAGKWLTPPIGYVGHNVNREVHYWRDVVNHLAPAFIKAPENRQWKEVPGVEAQGWIQPGEQMTEEWLRAIVTEKDYGVALAEESVRLIDEARVVLEPSAYDELHHYFARTLLTARLHRAVAAVYFGSRVFGRGVSHETEYVRTTIRNGRLDIAAVAAQIRTYPIKPAVGQWDWTKDGAAAEKYLRPVTSGSRSNAGGPFPLPGRGFALTPRSLRNNDVFECATSKTEFTFELVD